MGIIRDSECSTISGILLLGGGRLVSRKSMEYQAPESPGESRISQQSLAEGRDGHMSVLLSDGRVVTAGGANGFWSLCTTEIYDPNANEILIF